MDFDKHLKLGETITKEFFEDLIQYCISKKVIHITTDIVVDPLKHFNKVIQATQKCSINIPKFKLQGFCFYVKNSSDAEVITVNPLNCMIDGSPDGFSILPSQTYLFTSCDNGDYIVLNASTSLINEGSSTLGILDVSFLAESDYPAGSTFTLPTGAFYIVGNNGLSVSVHGSSWYKNFQYQELGAKSQRSSSIKLLQAISKDDEINIRILNPALLQTNILEVSFTSNEDLPKDMILTLPNNLSYQVGSNGLTLSVHGTTWYKGFQYLEIGKAGDTSYTIQLLQSIKAGDEVRFRIIGLPNAFGVNTDKTDCSEMGTNVFVETGILRKGESSIILSHKYDSYYTELYISGIRQQDDSWFIKNNKVIINDTAPEDLEYDVVIYTATINGVSVDGSVSGTYVGVESGTLPSKTNTITLSREYPLSTYYIEVYLDGVRQMSTSWSLDGKFIKLSDTDPSSLNYDVVIYKRSINTRIGSSNISSYTPDITIPSDPDPVLTGTTKIYSGITNTNNQTELVSLPENYTQADLDALHVKSLSELSAYYDAQSDDYVLTLSDESKKNIDDLSAQIESPLTKVSVYMDKVLPNPVNYSENDLFILNDD